MLLLAPALTGCDFPDRGFFAPHGPVAAADAHLFFVVVTVMAIVVVPVFILTPWFAWRYRLGNAASPYRPNWDFSWPLEVLIWVLPTAIVIGLGFMLWRYTHALDPYRPIASVLRRSRFRRWGSTGNGCSSTRTSTSRPLTSLPFRSIGRCTSASPAAR